MMISQRPWSLEIDALEDDNNRICLELPIGNETIHHFFFSLFYAVGKSIHNLCFTFSFDCRQKDSNIYLNLIVQKKEE